MKNVLLRLESVKIIPVAVIEAVSYAIPLAQALQKGGLNAIEVTFRTEAAAESIRLIRKMCPDMLVGAGTICTKAQLLEALDAGAQFIVSPGMVEEVAEECLKRGMPVIPGCVTPTEVLHAMHMGLSVVKFFPAEQFGGIKTVKALGQVFGNMRFMPTGGISLQNLEEYLKCDSVIACGGSYMADKKLIKEGRYEEITELSKRSVAIRDSYCKH